MQCHRASNTLAPPLPFLATGLPRQGGGEVAQMWCWRKRMGSRVRGQSHTSSNMPGAPITHQSRPHAWVRVLSHTHTHTHSVSLVASPSKLSARPCPSISLLGPHPACPSHPGPFLGSQDCPQEKSLSQMPQGFDLYTVSPAQARGVRGTEAWSTTPSSTFLPPMPESNQTTRSPLLIGSDKPT